MASKGFKYHLLALQLVWCQLVAVAPPLAYAESDKTDPSSPVQKQDNGDFLRRHQALIARGHAGPVELLFLGDSITQFWERAPHIWNAYYGGYQAANFGSSGDRTQHVIWRIEHDELAGLSPKVTVLMLGTNNSLDDSAEEIIAANQKVINLVRAKMPSTKILMLAIFPRGARSASGAPVTAADNDEATKRMHTIARVNQELAKLENGDTVRFLNINREFMCPEGHIPQSIMPDQLHPSAAGYQIWAEAMQPLLKAMMNN